QYIGNLTRVKVVKNKVAAPFRTVDIEIIYGKGISREGEILDMAVEYDIINKSGAWFSYNDEKIGQGRENVKAYILSNPDFAAEVEEKIKEQLTKKDED
ncbi:MAG: DNA recombination/repair protein RecA, partial [Bacilli bacterium]|nr:DNA recombination/repair protein RecA [Bacilli bacterium]